jgi:hypothetical protein
LSSQSGKVYEKKHENKKTCYDEKIEKIHITSFFLKTYSLPYLDNITGGLQREYLKTDLYA